MGNQSDDSITAALTFNIPQKVGWSLQCGTQSWSGTELKGLVEHAARGWGNQSATLSLTLLVDLDGDSGTVRGKD